MSAGEAGERAVCARLEDWPPADREAWLTALQPRRTPFRQNGGGITRNAFSIRKARSGYGRWISFLDQAGWLDPTARPEDRPTPERLVFYLERLQACGNGNQTIISLMQELRTALQWMCRGNDFRWITQPDGESLKSLLPVEQKSVSVLPSSDVLMEWAQELFEEGITLPKARARCAQVREAVMIGILTFAAPRLRALSSLRLGDHLRRDGDAWMLDQTPKITKAKNRIFLPLSPEIGAMLDRYLAVERQDLLHGKESDALWISWDGDALARHTISSRIRIRTARRFGQAFGPHRFRACLATTQALEQPDAPLDASLILGHGPAVTLAHYNLATAVRAAARHSERLKRLREGFDKEE